MSNFKQKKYTSKSGKSYTFQFPGVRAASQISDRTKNKFGQVSEEKLAEEMFKHVIVEPKVTWDFFGNDKQEFNEIVGEAYKFLEGVDEDVIEDGDK